MLEQFAAEETRLNVGAEPGTDVSVALAGGGTVRFRAIYRPVSQLANIGEVIQYDGIAAMLQCSTEDVQDVARGDVATVEGLTYQVVGIDVNRAGRTDLVLGI